MSNKVTELSLFTGMGGGIYGSLILGWKTLAYVERDEYCQKVIKQRIKDGCFDDGHVYGDIKEFNKQHASKYTGKIDILTGGFPCQPFSVAGKRKGTSDERYLFDEIIKTIKIVQPRRLFFENVPGILASDAIIKIYQSLHKIGYQSRPPLVLGSADCGNIHKRERVWIFATHTHTSTNKMHTRAKREKNHPTEKIRTTISPRQPTGAINCIHPTHHRCQRIQRHKPKALPRQQTLSRRESIRSLEDIYNRSDIPEPLLRRMDDELPNWSKQLKAIGNGQDPVVMATAWCLLSGEQIYE